MKTCPAGHPTAFRTCVRCLDMIAAARIDLTQRKKREKETRGRKKGMAPTRPFPNEIGKRYGRLTVFHRHSLRGAAGGVEWLCLCDCGKEKVVLGSSLRRGQCKSCGCLRTEARHRPRKIILSEADRARAKRISDKLNAKAIARIAPPGTQEIIQAMMRRRA